MATLAQLNVRLGFLFDDKSLKSVERSLRTTGKRLADIGSEMTAAISVPMLGLGAAAIKSAGDIESLTLALKSQLGSAGEAAKELQLLTEAAKNPGLGVEQAVRGSVRLQGVKLSAEEARSVLVQMGNAIAATGGSAQELDAVTRQFAQMISKGRVLQEDVSVLSENMPGLADLMQRAFGTTNVEAIRAMGISGKEFVLQITKAAETIPRVEGGIKNSIGNALDSLKQSAAKVGLALNEAFNITGALESVSAALLSVAQAFASLDPETQKFILTLAGIVIAIGPVLKAYGALKLFGSQVVSAWRDLVGGAKSLIAWLGQLRAAFLALNATIQAFLIVGLAAALFAIADQMGAFSKQLSNAEKAQQLVNSVTKDATASIEGERAKVGALVAVINDNTKSLQEKKSALAQLKQISPQYFGDLDIEKGKISDVTIAMNAYIRSLERSAIVKQATDEIARLSTELANVKDNSDPTALQYLTNAVKTLAFGPLAAATGGFQKFNENTKAFNEIDIREATNQKIDALRKLVAENIDLAAVTEDTTKKTYANADALKEAERKATLLKEVLSDIQVEKDLQELTGAFDLSEVLDKTGKGIQRLLDGGFSKYSEAVQKLTAEYKALNNEISSGAAVKVDTANLPIPAATSVSSQNAAPALPTLNLKGPAEEAAVVLENLSPKFQQLAADIGLGESALVGLNEGMAAVASVAGSAFEELAGSALGVSGAYTRMGAAALAAAAKIMKAALASTLATAIKDSFARSGNPLIGIAIAGVAVAAVNALFGRITQSLSKVPTYAKGTPYHKGGMAIVGELGPEMVELPAGSKVHTNSATNRMISNMSGYNVQVSGAFRLQGTELIAAIERTNAKNNRMR